MSVGVEYSKIYSLHHVEAGTLSYGGNVFSKGMNGLFDFRKEE